MVQDFLKLRIVEHVYLFILIPDFERHGSIAAHAAVDRSSQLFLHKFGQSLQSFPGGHWHLFSRSVQYSLANILGEMPDALEVVSDLQRRNRFTQVNRKRLSARNDFNTFRFDGRA